MFYNNGSFQNDTMLDCLTFPNYRPWVEVLVWIVTVLCLVAPILVFVIIYRNPCLQTAPNMLLASMTVSDFIFALGTPVGTIYSKFLSNSLVCITLSLTGVVSMLVSEISLAVISVERFYAIMKPFKARIASSRSRWHTIVAIWSFAIIVAAVVIFAGNGSSVFCYSEDSVDFYLHITVFFVCFFIQCCLYCIVGVNLRGRLPPGQDERAAKKLAKNRRIITMLFAVVLLFILTWGPINVSALHEDDFALIKSCWFLDLSFFFILAPFCNAFLNPLVYFIFMANYRRGLKDLVRTCLPRCFRKLSPKMESYELEVNASHGTMGAGAAATVITFHKKFTQNHHAN